jgi:DNA polymerase
LAHALPASLDKVAAALKLCAQKDADGHRLMLQMAKPRRQREGDLFTDLLWFDDPARRERLYAYCKQDTATERELHKHIGFLTQEEQTLWELDARINDRGIPLDTALLHAALTAAEVAQNNIAEEFNSLTQGSPESINQAARLLAWLHANGCEHIKDIKKTTLEELLEDSELPATTRRVIELRLAGAHASVNKLGTMADWCDGGRVRGAFRYHGAHTGRWTSLGVQLQNLKRPETEDLNAAITATLSGQTQTMATIGDLGRAIIAASPGTRFIAADLSGIESRITAWVAGQQSKVNQWAKFDTTKNAEDEPYRRVGLDCFNLPEDIARDVGKVGDLAFGYAGGIGAWRKLASNDTRTDDEIKALQQSWRNAHPNIVEFWKSLDRSAVRAVRNPGTTIECGKVSFRMEDVFLKLRLPSGRDLSYPFPRLIENDRGDSVVVFKDNAQGKFIDCRQGHGAYGGLFCENVVQAIARDVFAAGMLNLERSGYPVCLHVHDEIVAEVQDGFGSVDEFVKILTAPPAWAEGLPLAAKGRNGPRFAKASAPVKPPQEAMAPEPPLAEPAPRVDEPPAAHTDELAAKAPPANNVVYYEQHRHNSDGPVHGNTGPKQGNPVAQWFYQNPPDQPNYLRVDKHITSEGKRNFYQHHWSGTQWVIGVKGTYAERKIPYLLPVLKAALQSDPDIEVQICEGEKDADTLARLGYVATTNPGGALSWTDDLTAWLRILGARRAAIHEDNDEKGRQRTAKLIAALGGFIKLRVVRYSDVPEGEDASWWIEDGKHTKEEMAERISSAKPAEPSGLESVRASSIQPRAIRWLWPGRFAVGKLGLVVGMPEEGKGRTLYYIASRITTSKKDWPCGEGNAPDGNVILLSAEEDLNDETIPRLMAAGADLDRVEIIRMVPQGDGKGKRMFSLVTDLELLRAKIAEVGNVRAVLIDPISAYLGVKKMDSFRGTDVRAVLAPLVDLAHELKISVIGIMHFNKKTDVTNILLRISDSLAFGAVARHVYAAIDDEENGRKVFVRGKNNNAEKAQKALAYTFTTRTIGTDPENGDPIVAPYIVWQPQPVDVNAAEIMSAASEPSKGRNQRKAAMGLLIDLLSAEPAICVAETEEFARHDLGISKRTLQRAKNELEIRSVKDGPEVDGEKTWRWHAPKQRNDKWKL